MTRDSQRANDSVVTDPDKAQIMGAPTQP